MCLQHSNIETITTFITAFQHAANSSSTVCSYPVSLYYSASVYHIQLLFKQFNSLSWASLLDKKVQFSVIHYCPPSSAVFLSFHSFCCFQLVCQLSLIFHQSYITYYNFMSFWVYPVQCPCVKCTEKHSQHIHTDTFSLSHTSLPNIYLWADNCHFKITHIYQQFTAA